MTDDDSQSGTSQSADSGAPSSSASQDQADYGKPSTPQRGTLTKAGNKK